MNSSVFDDPKIGKTPRYETSIDSCVYSQGFQPVFMGEKSYGQEEIPIYYQDEVEEKATVHGIFLILLVQLIPIVGILMAVKWSLAKDNNYVRRVVSRALLIFYPVLAVAITLGYYFATATM